jgi:hypothetical protein
MLILKEIQNKDVWENFFVKGLSGAGGGAGSGTGYDQATDRAYGALAETASDGVYDKVIGGPGFQPLFFQSWTWGELEKLRGKKVFYLGFFSSAAQQEEKPQPVIQEGAAQLLVTPQPLTPQPADRAAKPLETQLADSPAGRVEDRLVAVALGVLVSARRGTFLHVRGGPVGRWQNRGEAQEISKLLIDFARELHCDFLRISPNIQKAETERSQWLMDSGFKYCQMHDVDAEVTWVLDLLQPEADILTAMRQQTRYSIKKAQKTPGLRIIKTCEIEDKKYFDAFWEIYSDTVKRQKWHAYSKNYLFEEFVEFVKQGQAMLFLAEYEGKFIAGSLFLYYQNQVFYHHSGSLTAFRRIPAMYLIHWESILEAKARGCNLYNFFGIARDDNPKHPWAGLTLFKKGFGGRQQEMVHALDFPITAKYKLTYYYEKIERSLRGY